LSEVVNVTFQDNTLSRCLRANEIVNHGRRVLHSEQVKNHTALQQFGRVREVTCVNFNGQAPTDVQKWFLDIIGKL
jgi:hypothetical protein